jgi:hypothetical protein
VALLNEGRYQAVLDRYEKANPDPDLLRVRAPLLREFPMTVTGKVRKIETREAAVGILGLQDVAVTKHA